jgi:hypothetical protein
MSKMKCAMGTFAVLFVLGCGPYTPKPATNDIQRSEKIILKDYKAKRYLRLVSHAVDRLPSGSLQVKVVLQNVKNSDLWCDVRVEFHDQTGNVVEEGNWEPMLFERRAEKTIERKSIDPRAADYRILVRKQE